MPETIYGLPSHILTIHAVVVLIPLATLGVVLMAALPVTRPVLRWPVLFVLTAGLTAVPVATRTGTDFKDRRLAEGMLGGPVLEKVVLHEQLANLVLWPTLAVWLLTVALVVLDRRARSARARPGAAVTVVAVLAVLAAGAATAQTVRAGHAGSTAVWNPTG